MTPHTAEIVLMSRVKTAELPRDVSEALREESRCSSDDELERLREWRDGAVVGDPLLDPNRTKR